MNIRKLFLFVCITVGISACAGLKTGKDRVVPEHRVQLKVSSLHAKKIQEQGLLGDGDELSLIYTINGYDEKGNLLVVNSGFWGTRTIGQDALILSDEFDKISVHIPKEGKVIVAIALIEVDDYKGERKIAKVKSYTKAERYPKFLSTSSFEEDQYRPPVELIAQSLKLAGYQHFTSRNLNLSINDDLGGTRQVYDATDLSKIITGARSGKETYEIDGSQVNENYLYILKYDLDLMRVAK